MVTTQKEATQRGAVKVKVWSYNVILMNKHRHLIILSCIQIIDLKHEPCYSAV